MVGIHKYLQEGEAVLGIHSHALEFEWWRIISNYISAHRMRIQSEVTTFQSAGVTQAPGGWVWYSAGIR